MALCFALALHGVFLLLPIVNDRPTIEKTSTSIELQLTTFSPHTPVNPEPLPLPEIRSTEPEAENEAELPPEPPATLPELEAKAASLAEQPGTMTVSPVVQSTRPDLEDMSETEKRQLTDTILARQFFTEESAADQLFGKPLTQHNTDIQKEFHYPLKPNLLAMLDQPLPEVPFAYTPDLVHFAYDPGVKGDFQRFWDVITPEFGWRTRYGTEVKCIMILVIIGCGWK